jgi:cytochrome b
MTAPQVKVWDPLIRLFHWSLAIAFAVAWYTQEHAYATHLNLGYTVLGLVLVRLVWGFVGTRHARFGDFVRGPGAVIGYLRALAAGRAPRYLGHNPAGGAMILALIATLLVIALSGIALDAAENRAGPLGGTQLFLYLDPILKLHAWATDLALALIAVHVLAVIHSSRALGENLVKAMITGRKDQAE